MTSFKAQRRELRPSEYRTPSPPASEIEPLTPLGADGNHAETFVDPRNGHTSPTGRGWWPHEQNTVPRLTDAIQVQASLSRPATSAMDAFATIALATSGPFHTNASIQTGHSSPLRTHEKSQFLYQRDASGFTTIPTATEVHPTVHRRDELSGATAISSITDDAELLLNVRTAGTVAHILNHLRRYDSQSLADIAHNHGEHKNVATTGPAGQSPPPKALGNCIQQLERAMLLDESMDESNNQAEEHKEAQTTSCAGCSLVANSLAGGREDEEASWIRCDGCQRWYHFACANLSEKEVRSVDKFSCRDCWATHGPTTYLRKSGRAHTAIDYARLNEGVVKTSDESPNHPYIKPLRERTIKCSPDNFARISPELVTLDFFEKGDGMQEPIVVPAVLNRPRRRTEEDCNYTEDTMVDSNIFSRKMTEDWLSHEYFYTDEQDCGQDRLDMVMPSGLTVRRVAELYGLQEKVDVIDVKSQGEAGAWNMKKWADYYESEDKKFVRNVISLELSGSQPARLIRRPKLARDLDLVDSVWPRELIAKGDFPKVKLYCLMSVADSYTDFHIDFGGSSVFYHILKGKKTFLFIPPKNKNLKKYEQWCLSPAQNQTFLPDQTNECIRVNLSEGDTMFIPSGWIHAVWTPEDSLVIGGNFLTRLHYGMQIRIAEIEKATKVPRKFRHPHFQRVLWYTAIEYLRSDPIPPSVAEALCEGREFTREVQPYYEYEQIGPASKPGPENYQARYYSRHELEGLSDLSRYLLRTALIAMGNITDGITSDTRQRVAKAIPKGHGEPLDLVKRFAIWAAWKRGNEQIPPWAFPDATIPVDVPNEKKPSAAMLKRQEREAALQVAPRRKSERRQRSNNQTQVTTEAAQAADECAMPSTTGDGNQQPGLSQFELLLAQNSSVARKRKAPYDELANGDGRKPTNNLATPAEKRQKTSPTSQRKPACADCRRRRRRCKHREGSFVPEDAISTSMDGVQSGITAQQNRAGAVTVHAATTNGGTNGPHFQATPGEKVETDSEDELRMAEASYDDVTRSHLNDPESHMLPKSGSASRPDDTAATVAAHAAIQGAVSSGRPHTPDDVLRSPKKLRNKACARCRKGKRHCVHDENGNVDPARATEDVSMRAPSSTLKRRSSPTSEQTTGAGTSSDTSPAKRPKHHHHETIEVRIPVKAQGMPPPAANEVVTNRQEPSASPAQAMVPTVNGLPLGLLCEEVRSSVQAQNESRDVEMRDVELTVEPVDLEQSASEGAGPVDAHPTDTDETAPTAIIETETSLLNSQDHPRPDPAIHQAEPEPSRQSCAPSPSSGSPPLNPITPAEGTPNDHPASRQLVSSDRPDMAVVIDTITASTHSLPATAPTSSGVRAAEAQHTTNNTAPKKEKEEPKEKEDELLSPPSSPLSDIDVSSLSHKSHDSSNTSKISTTNPTSASSGILPGPIITNTSTTATTAPSRKRPRPNSSPGSGHEAYTAPARRSTTAATETTRESPTNSRQDAPRSRRSSTRVRRRTDFFVPDSAAAAAAAGAGASVGTPATTTTTSVVGPALTPPADNPDTHMRTNTSVRTRTLKSTGATAVSAATAPPSSARKTKAMTTKTTPKVIIKTAKAPSRTGIRPRR